VSRLERVAWTFVDGVDGDPVRQFPALELHAGGSRFTLLWHPAGHYLGKLPAALERDPVVARLVAEFEQACRAGQFAPKEVLQQTPHKAAKDLL